MLYCCAETAPLIAGFYMDFFSYVARKHAKIKISFTQTSPSPL